MPEHLMQTLVEISEMTNQCTKGADLNLMSKSIGTFGGGKVLPPVMPGGVSMLCTDLLLSGLLIYLDTLGFLVSHWAAGAFLFFFFFVGC